MSANKVRPPEKDDSKLILLTIILVVLAMVLSILAYIMTYGLQPEPITWAPHGGFSVEVTGNTTAKVILYTITGDPPITKLKVEMVVGTNSSIHSFGIATNGTIASLDSGPDVGTITYWDRLDNEEVNSGDKLLLTNLKKNTDYTLYLIWAPDGDVIEQEDFTTPE